MFKRLNKDYCRLYKNLKNMNKRYAKTIRGLRIQLSIDERYITFRHLLPTLHKGKYNVYLNNLHTLEYKEISLNELKKITKLLNRRVISISAKNDIMNICLEFDIDIDLERR